MDDSSGIGEKCEEDQMNEKKSICFYIRPGCLHVCARFFSVEHVNMVIDLLGCCVCENRVQEACLAHKDRVIE